MRNKIEQQFSKISGRFEKVLPIECTWTFSATRIDTTISRPLGIDGNI